MKNEDYVSFEQAIKLREMGFSDETRCGYYKMPKGSPQMTKWDICLEASLDYNLEFYKAPTLAQVQKWLRESKGIHIEIRYTINPQYEPWIGKIIVITDYPNTIIDTDTCDTYEEALSEAIDKALELLKEK